MELGHEVFQEVDIFISSPWVLSRLRKQDSLGRELELAGARFLVHTSANFVFVAKKFSRARTFAKLFKFATLFGAAPIFEVLGKAGFFPRVIESMEVESSQRVFSDIVSLNSELTPRDLSSLYLFTGAHLYSLFHGTLEIEAKPLELSTHLLEIFSRVSLFETGPHQTKRLSSIAHENQITLHQLVSPRLRIALKCRADMANRSRDRVVTFLTRRPTELPDFNFIKAWVSLAVCSHNLRKAGYQLFRLKGHPNESIWLKRVEVLLLNLFFRRRDFKVMLSSERSHELYKNTKVLTWFSGLVVELGLAGVPCAEIYGSKSSSWLGPKVSPSSDWNRIYQRGLVTRLCNSSELFSWLNEKSDYQAPPISSFEEQFYLDIGGTVGVSSSLASHMRNL